MPSNNLENIGTGVPHVNLEVLFLKFTISICVLATYRDFENVNFVIFFEFSRKLFGIKNRNSISRNLSITGKTDPKKVTFLEFNIHGGF